MRALSLAESPTAHYAPLTAISAAEQMVGQELEPKSGSFDDLIGACEDRLRHGEAERLRCLEIDDQLEFGWLFDW